MTDSKNTNAVAALLNEMRELGKDVEADTGLDQATKAKARVTLSRARRALTEALENLTPATANAALVATRKVAGLWPMPKEYHRILSELEELALVAGAELPALRKAA